jgi:5-methylthioadenosine/S-adenosylhomocysteine deaminase
MTGDSLLRGARVLDLGGELDLPPVADVLIRDGAIAAVGSDLAAQAAGAEVVNLSGHLLIPGFVNGHYHSNDILAKGSFETMPLEQWGLVASVIGNNRSLEEVRVRTLLGAVECLRNGITTVQDFSVVAPMDDRYVDAILDAYDEAGLRVIFSITIRDRSQLDTILGAREAVPPALHGIVGTGAGDPQEQLAFVERQIERVGDRGGRIIWALSPSAPQRCSPRLLEGVAELAGRRDLPVYTHVYETRLQRQFAQHEYPQHGGSAIAYMKSVGLVGPRVTIAHGVWPDAAEIEMLAATKTGVVLNMLSNLKLRSGVAPITAYRRSGLRLALGCDNCSCSDVQSMFQVMKLYCLMGGIADTGSQTPTAAEALDLATRGGAASAGRADRLGAIRPGRRADLVALDLADPAYRPLNSVARQLVFAETGRAVRHVWVDGRQVVRDGRTTRVDEERLASALSGIMPTVTRDLARLKADAEKVRPHLTEMYRRSWESDLPHDRYLRRS